MVSTLYCIPLLPSPLRDFDADFRIEECTFAVIIETNDDLAPSSNSTEVSPSSWAFTSSIFLTFFFFFFSFSSFHKSTGNRALGPSACCRYTPTFTKGRRRVPREARTASERQSYRNRCYRCTFIIFDS